jgi:hypothetical protein
MLISIASRKQQAYCNKIAIVKMHLPAFLLITKQKAYLVDRCVANPGAVLGLFFGGQQAVVGLTPLRIAVAIMQIRSQPGQSICQ